MNTTTTIETPVAPAISQSTTAGATITATAPRSRGRPRKAVPTASSPGASADRVAGSAPSTAAVATSAVSRPARPGLSVRGLAACASDRARLVAAMVLEVLCAARTPAEAATVLDVVPVRYYQLEARALAGLIRGCEPVTKGRPVDGGGGADDRLRADHVRVLAENRRLTGEIGRLQTLLRTARTAFGLRPEVAVAAVAAARGAAKGKGKTGKRRPRVRALRLAGLVRPTDSTSAATPDTVAPNPGGGQGSAAVRPERHAGG